MTKAELVERLAERTGLSPDDAAAAVEALFAVAGGIIAEEVANGTAVQIGDFGSFEPGARRTLSQRGRQAAEDEDADAPPLAPVFKPGDGWRQAGPRVRGGKPPRGTGSTGPRRGPWGEGGPR